MRLQLSAAQEQVTQEQGQSASEFAADADKMPKRRASAGSAEARKLRIRGDLPGRTPFALSTTLEGALRAIDVGDDSP